MGSLAQATVPREHRALNSYESPRILLLASDPFHDPLILSALDGMGVSCDLLRPPWGYRQLLGRLWWCDFLLTIYGNVGPGFNRIRLLARLMGKPTGIYWIGTDAIRFHAASPGTHFVTRHLVSRSVTVSENLSQKLSEVGIKAPVVPILTNYRSWSPTPWPERFTVLVYLPAGYFSFYRGPTVLQIARLRPNYQFLVVGADRCEAGAAPPNVTFLGKVQDMEPVYAASTTLLRLTPHDGLPKMPIEAMAMNRPVLYNHSFPHAITVYNDQDILDALDRLSEQPFDGTAGRRFAMSFPTAGSLTEQFVRALGLDPPTRPNFQDTGEKLRDRLQEIYSDETSWSPTAQGTRDEHQEELEALIAFSHQHQGWALDAGSGAGRGALAVAAKAKSVAALDLSVESLLRSRSAARSAGCDNVYPVVGDAERLPFRQESFSSGIGVEVWAHLKYPTRFAFELSRVMKQGASLAISTGNARSLIEFYNRLRVGLYELRRGRLRETYKALSGDRDYWLTLRAFARDTVASVMAELRGAGFTILSRTGVGLLRTPGADHSEALSGLPLLRDFGHLFVIEAQRKEASRPVASYANLAAYAIDSFFEKDGTIQYRSEYSPVNADTQPPPYSTSERYRLICLIGLESYQKFARGDREFGVRIQSISQGLKHLGLDDQGLLLWWKSLAGTNDIEEARRRIAETQLHFGLLDTQTLAFLLLGLSTATPLSANCRPLADLTEAAIRARQERTGLFHTVSRRDRVSTFNYQIYASMALATYGEITGRSEAIESARACAQKLCELQGPLGQWWWTYNVRRGTVADRYPVFSVHQLGMAPMALFRIGRVVGDDFSPWIRRGARWVAGANEVGQSLITPDGTKIWRSIRRKAAQSPVKARLLKRLAWNGLGWAARIFPTKEINLEHRPYEYGWLLTALAESRGDEAWLP